MSPMARVRVKVPPDGVVAVATLGSVANLEGSEAYSVYKTTFVVSIRRMAGGVACATASGEHAAAHRVAARAVFHCGGSMFCPLRRVLRFITNLLLARIRNRRLGGYSVLGERRKIAPAILLRCQTALNAVRNWSPDCLLDSARSV